MKSAWLMAGLGLVLVPGGCGEDAAPKDPIKIGLSYSDTGADAEFGGRVLDVVRLAVQEINDKGGIDGHTLELVFRDDATDEAQAAAVVKRLIEEDGVVAVIGPFFSSAVAATLDDLKAHEVPLISPSATNPALASADDDGYLFRDVPHDEFQGLAVTYYLRNVANPAVDDIVIIAEEGDYGEGLAQAVKDAYEAKGGAVAGEFLLFPSNLDPQNPDHAMVLDNLMVGLNAADSATHCVLIALANDGNIIFKEWANTATRPELVWFGTDGLRSEGFLQGLPDSALGMLGTAPTVPRTGSAYPEFVAAFLEEYQEDIDQEAYMANTWDATYLIALGLLDQAIKHPGEPFGGPDLRDSITLVSRDGQVLRASQWRDIKAVLESGGDVDYDGASGPVNFDEDGESIGPYEVWKIENADGGFGFAQDTYLEAEEIEGLL